ncbi:MAG: DUF3817 domain-containing protein [bacterium]|nr:DUF3817 domain-containing protein [bacterium]
MELVKTALGRFRIVAFLEGLSFLAILFITMPLKYGFDQPMPNKYVGMAHGVLFIAYIMMVIQLKFEKGWENKLTFLSLLASIVPFGTFYMEHKHFKQMDS